MTATLVAGGYAATFALVLGIGGRHGGFGWELAALLVLVGYPLAVLVGLAHALGARTRRVAAAAPLGFLLAGLLGVAGVRAADDSLHERRFTRHRAELEALLGRASLGSGDRMRLPLDSLSPDVRSCCARAVFVRRDAEGHLSATVVGSRRTAYLYDPTGARLERGLGAGRWRSHQRLAPAWYRVVRF